MTEIERSARRRPRSAAQRDETRERPQQGRLSGAVGAPYQGQPGQDLEEDPPKDGSVVEDHRGIVEGCGSGHLAQFWPRTRRKRIGGRYG